MLLYSLTIFLSAFLLFQVQPIIAKMILPWFGGSSAVWSTCMLFFQVVLLLGYLYAHWLHEKLAPRRQAVAHIAALVVSFAALPILPNPGWKSAGVAHPSLTILALLSLPVGLPYFLLSSTSPLLQAWYARTHREGMPYRLFALSNFASMLALLSYPFLVVPNLPTRVQGGCGPPHTSRSRRSAEPPRGERPRTPPRPKRRSRKAPQPGRATPPGRCASCGWACPPAPRFCFWP